MTRPKILGVNRRNFIKKLIGAGAALYVPEKTYGFLFADKCGSWRDTTIALKMTFDTGTGIWAPSSAESKREADRLVKAFHKEIPTTVWTLAK